MIGLAELRDINATAAFNRWAGIEVVRAEPGEVEIRLLGRPELGQYAGSCMPGSSPRSSTPRAGSRPRP